MFLIVTVAAPSSLRHLERSAGGALASLPSLDRATSVHPLPRCDLQSTASDLPFAFPPWQYSGSRFYSRHLASATYAISLELKSLDSPITVKIDTICSGDQQLEEILHVESGSGPSNSSSSPAKACPVANKSIDSTKPIATKLTSEAHQPDSAGGSQNMSADQMGTPCPTAITHHTLLRVGSRSKIEALMAPPASDAATLRRQVESLQLDLEAHIENEQHLQDVNQQLRDRLELYMKQNHENVERAEAEFNTLHEDMEQTLELQRRLAQRSASLEKEKKTLEQALKNKMQEFEDERSLLRYQIDKMCDDLLVRTSAQAQAEALQAELEATLASKNKLETYLQNSMDEAELLKHEVEKLNSDLCELIAKEKRDQVLEKSHKTCLLKRFFRGLLLAVRHQQLRDAKVDSAFSFAKLSCCRRGLNSLQTAALRAKQLRLGYRRRAQACLEECFKAWKLYHLASRNYRQAALRRQKNRIRRMFVDWHYTVKTGRMSEGEENRLMLLSKRYWSTAFKKRTLKHWTRWIRYWAKPLKGKLKLLQNRLEKLTCGQAFALWKCFVRMRKMKRFRIIQACLHVKYRTQEWTFNRWREKVMLKIMQNLLILKCLNLRRSLLYQKVLKSWSLYVQWKHRKHMSRAVSFRHYLHVLQAKAIAWWKVGAKQRQAEMRALQEVNHALARAAMLLWRDYHVLVSKKKKKEKMASVFKERRLRKVARNLLLFWWEEMQWNRATAHFMQILASRRRHNLLSNALHSWMHFTFENLLVANAKFQSDLLDAKAQCEAQKNQTTAVDVENLQLIDRLHAMSSDIAHLKITICDKVKQEEDLHQSLEDTAVVQSTMRAELEQQHFQIEELELESITLQKKLQSQNTKENVGEVQHALEIEGLEKAIKTLQNQIEEKSSQIESYAKALKDTAEKLEGTSDESQEQLSNAFEIAGSLRKILDDRENQFATLEGNCRRRELELGEVQRKLAASTNSFAETIEARDARIRELEGNLAHKQNEVQESQQEMQDLQMALDAKESLVRKLEYEMKLKSDRDSSRTKTFVSSLSSWSSAAGQLDALAGFQMNAHSIQMESMKHVYMQTKAALQQGISPDHCVSGYRVSAFKVQTKPSNAAWRVYGPSSPLQEKKAAFLPSHPFNREDDVTKGSDVEQPEDPSNHNIEGKTRQLDLQRHTAGTSQDLATNSQERDCGSMPTECSHRNQQGISSILSPIFKGEALGSFPSSYHGFMKKGDNAAVFSLHNDEMKKHPKSESSRSSNFKLFLEPVDSLHVEIQQLQARILERMKSSNVPEGSSKS
ncbi:hypothetical protein GOP47_0026216 [Adiantum capillus-veneris]|nr:hypothetical protein GOP47_0026216 [Adiantum capillus-veneris]